MKRLAPIELRFPSHVWWQSRVNLPWKSPRDEMWITMNHHWSALWTINSSIMMMVNYSLWWTVIYIYTYPFLAILVTMSRHSSRILDQGPKGCHGVGLLGVWWWRAPSHPGSSIISMYPFIHPLIYLSMHLSICILIWSYMWYMIMIRVN